MEQACVQCDRPLMVAGTGRPKVYCGQTCRKRASRAARAAAFPVSMTGRDVWVRADGKRPIMRDGGPASSTDPATWAAYAAVQSGAGDGFGIMLGGGLACYDLDGVTDAEAWEFIRGVSEPVVFAERSVSGRGVHVFVEAPEGPGWRRGGVEFYPRARFIRVTGNVFHAEEVQHVG